MFSSENQPDNNKKGKKGSRVHLKVTKQELATLFGVSVFTLDRWARLDLINLKDIKDIIDKFNNRHLLDRRRKYTSHTPNKQ